MLSFTISLHGSMVVRMETPLTVAQFLFKMAFISAWQTYGYLVVSGSLEGNIGKLILEKIYLGDYVGVLPPRHFVVVAANGHPVVADADNHIVRIADDGADLEAI